MGPGFRHDTVAALDVADPLPTTRPATQVRGVPLAAVIAVAVPAFGAFLILAGFVVAEAAGWRPLAVAPPATLAEAAAIGDAARVQTFIARGDDPSQRSIVPRDVLDARGAMRITAVQAALLARRPEVVRLLLRRGARADQPRELACLAQAVGEGGEVPPAVFEAPDAHYYDGPQLGGLEALMRCGIPYE